jgi:hypothetical protein
MDSTYAPPLAAMAETYVTITQAWEALPAHETMPKARTAAERALALDPNLAEAHTALALVSMHYDWDLARAEQAFREAGGRRTEGDAPHLSGQSWSNRSPMPTIRVSVRARLPRPWKAILTPSELDEADAGPVGHALDRSPRQPRSFAYAVTWPTSDVANSRNESRALGSLKSPLGPVSREDMMRHAES